MDSEYDERLRRAKPGRQSGEGIVAPQTVLDTARECCVDRRLALWVCVDQVDTEMEAAGLSQPSDGPECGVCVAGFVPRDGGAGRPGSP